jgi:hypothetical protein
MTIMKSNHYSIINWSWGLYQDLGLLIDRFRLQYTISYRTSLLACDMYEGSLRTWSCNFTTANCHLLGLVPSLFVEIIYRLSTELYDTWTFVIALRQTSLSIESIVSVSCPNFSFWNQNIAIQGPWTLTSWNAIADKTIFENALVVSSIFAFWHPQKRDRLSSIWSAGLDIANLSFFNYSYSGQIWNLPEGADSLRSWKWVQRSTSDGGPVTSKVMSAIIASSDQLILQIIQTHEKYSFWDKRELLSSYSWSQENILVYMDMKYHICYRFCWWRSLYGLRRVQFVVRVNHMA